MFLKPLRTPNTKLPPLLLFDYDGVIADSIEVYFSEFTRACTEFGFDHINSKEAFLNLFDGNLVAQLIKAGFPLRKMRALAEKFAPQIEAANQRIHPFPGMIETLARLGDKYPLLVITANSSAVVQRFVEKYGLRQVRGILGSDVETSKVKKIRAARRRFRGCCPYYIGDTKGDMIEARRAGAVPVAATWGWHDKERLMQGTPEFLVRTQEELLALFNIPPP
jgi:phosphoglycolate phosphatase